MAMRPVVKVRSGIRLTATLGAMLILPLLLAACGPMSLGTAEQQCFERARLAQQPRGEVNVGATSNRGAVAGLELTLTSDYLLRKDPSAVYDSCVMSKSGQFPSRPLSSRPDWKG